MNCIFCFKEAGDNFNTCSNCSSSGRPYLQTNITNVPTQPTTNNLEGWRESTISNCPHKDNWNDCEICRPNFSKTIEEIVTIINLFNKQVLSDYEVKLGIKDVIKRLRKHDEEELIKMLPEYKEIEYCLNLESCQKAFGFNDCRRKVKQLIEDYYNK